MAKVPGVHLPKIVTTTGRWFLNGSNLLTKILKVHPRSEVTTTWRGGLKLSKYGYHAHLQAVSSDDPWLILPVYQ